jgi:hypothetical protein
MASAAQIDANRLNAQHSTGPKTPAGKDTASRNRTSHGLASGVLFLEGDDPALFNTLLCELVADHRPVGMTEEILVFKLAEQIWFGDRASRLLTQALDRNTREDNAKQVSLMLRYKTSADRGFHQTLNQLLKLKKERPQPEIGSVSKIELVPAAPPQPENGFVSQTPRSHPKVGRNEPCPCGSGLKFKRCCIGRPIHVPLTGQNLTVKDLTGKIR